ncbi:hypothetical protein [Acinetobacter sp. MB5]|uniref:hypothetical protein n=1 Tax=Acinetobacter sp. MB5 TaxID=2069438 RepID=UPI000DD01432|nr:hypothetical protein [Acinetobacter sp. MB5]
MNKYIFNLIFLIFSTFLLTSCGHSNPYSSGEIKFSTKNNLPCLYIDEEDIQGDYSFSIIEHQIPEPMFDYVSSFKENYPKKDNCLMINNENFKGLKIKLNTPYDIQMEVDKPDQYSIYRKNIFCVRSEKGKKIMQTFDGFKCSDIPAEETTK